MTRIRPRLVAAAALAAALFAAGCAIVAEGKTAPPIRGNTWVQASGNPDTLLDGKWGLIVFFRPGSVTCAEEMPAVLALQKEFGPKGLVVVGVTAADAEATAAFAKETGITFPVLTEGRGLIADSYGVPEVNELHTYLVNPPGVVIVQGDLAKARQVLAEYMAAGKK